jgi:hypothetical protein
MGIQSKKTYLCMALILTFSIAITKVADCYLRFWEILPAILDTTHVYLESQVKNQQLLELS